MLENAKDKGREFMMLHADDGINIVGWTKRAIGIRFRKTLPIREIEDAIRTFLVILLIFQENLTHTNLFA